MIAPRARAGSRAMERRGSRANSNTELVAGGDATPLLSNSAADVEYGSTEESQEKAKKQQSVESQELCSAAQNGAAVMASQALCMRHRDVALLHSVPLHSSLVVRPPARPSAVRPSVRPCLCRLQPSTTPP
jgi:hypothetical protein